MGDKTKKKLKDFISSLKLAVFVLTATPKDQLDLWIIQKISQIHLYSLREV